MKSTNLTEEGGKEPLLCVPNLSYDYLSSREREKKGEDKKNAEELRILP